MRCPLPPLAEQERSPFGYDAPYGDTIAAKVARYERLRAQMPPSGMLSEAERQVEGLFQGLFEQSFGE